MASPSVPVAFAVSSRDAGRVPDLSELLASAGATPLVSAGAPVSSTGTGTVAARRERSNALVWRLPSGGAVAAPVTPADLTALLTTTLRGVDLAVAVLLDRPISNIKLYAEQALCQAQRAPHAVFVDAAPTDARRPPLTAALRLTAVTLRGRSAAAWRAIDALDANHGNAARAAASLGCAGQTVREHRARGHYHATVELQTLFETLLHMPMA